MRFTVQYPIANAAYDPRFLSGKGLIRFAKTAEQAGFHAIAFTDHPAPSDKWLRSGGHDSFDPLSALSFCAAVTNTIRLMSYVLVLPYRNPLLAAKQGATVDALSDGRLTLVLGAGYLRSEFAALGVGFTERNALLDEGIDVLKGIWTSDDFHYKGNHFTALGQTAHPRPLQSPHPPLWFGGNSERALRRVAMHGQGWSPLIIPESISESVRTRSIGSATELAIRIRQLRDLLAEQGRTLDEIDVQIDYAAGTAPNLPADRILDSVSQFAEAGANWAVVTPRGERLEDTLAELVRYGDTVIAKFKPQTPT